MSDANVAAARKKLRDRALKPLASKDAPNPHYIPTPEQARLDAEVARRRAKKK